MLELIRRHGGLSLCAKSALLQPSHRFGYLVLLEAELLTGIFRGRLFGAFGFAAGNLRFGSCVLVCGVVSIVYFLTSYPWCYPGGKYDPWFTFKRF